MADFDRVPQFVLRGLRPAAVGTPVTVAPECGGFRVARQKREEMVEALGREAEVAGNCDSTGPLTANTRSFGVSSYHRAKESGCCSE